MGMGSEDIPCGLRSTTVVENASHLFSACEWAMEVWGTIQQWLGINMHDQGVQELIMKIKQKHWHMEQ